MQHDGDSDTEEYDTDDEYLSTDLLKAIFEAVPSRTRPNCYSFSMAGGPIFSSIWVAARKRLGGDRFDLGAIEEAQIKLIKRRIKKDIEKELRPEAEEKAFACLEKDIGKSPVHRRRSTFGGKSTRKKRKRKRRRTKKKKERPKKASRKGRKRRKASRNGRKRRKASRKAIRRRKK